MPIPMNGSGIANDSEQPKFLKCWIKKANVNETFLHTPNPRLFSLSLNTA